MKHCCRVQVILKEFICSNIECIGDGDQLLQFWSLHASLYYTHVINAVIYSGASSSCVMQAFSRAALIRFPNAIWSIQ